MTESLPIQTNSFHIENYTSFRMTVTETSPRHASFMRSWIFVCEETFNHVSLPLARLPSEWYDTNTDLPPHWELG